VIVVAVAVVVVMVAAVATVAVIIAAAAVIVAVNDSRSTAVATDRIEVTRGITCVSYRSHIGARDFARALVSPKEIAVAVAAVAIASSMMRILMIVIFIIPDKRRVELAVLMRHKSSFNVDTEVRNEQVGKIVRHHR
jgi:hypothetical protein